MNNQQALTGSADALQHFLASQAELFLFDLKNEAAEHGFGSSRTWNLQLLTDAEMLDLKKQHHPVISIKLQPETLLKVYQIVKSKLQQSLNTNDAALTPEELSVNEKWHMAAYPTQITRK